MINFKFKRVRKRLSQFQKEQKKELRKHQIQQGQTMKNMARALVDSIFKS